MEAVVGPTGGPSHERPPVKLLLERVIKGRRSVAVGQYRRRCASGSAFIKPGWLSTMQNRLFVSQFEGHAPETETVAGSTQDMSPCLLFCISFAEEALDAV